MTPPFLAYLDGLAQTEYPHTHRLRYWETWSRLHDLAAGSRDVLELGAMSPIGGFLRDRHRARLATVETDLRYPWAVPDESADLVLCLEVLEHLNDAHHPGASIGEIGMFTGSGARNTAALGLLKNAQ